MFSISVSENSEIPSAVHALPLPRAAPPEESFVAGGGQAQRWQRLLWPVDLRMDKVRTRISERRETNNDVVCRTTTKSKQNTKAYRLVQPNRVDGHYVVH